MDGPLGGPVDDPGDDPARGWRAVLCADLTTLAARTVPTPVGYLGVYTAKEWTGRAVEFWAGAALAPDAPDALAGAVADALLAPWGGSVVTAGAARLVAAGTCRAARVLDAGRVTTFGPALDFPPLGAPGVTPRPGARLAMRRPSGEYRAIAVGSATVTLHLGPDPGSGARVGAWFDALEAAHG